MNVIYGRNWKCNCHTKNVSHMNIFCMGCSMYTEHRINQWILVRLKKNCHWCVRKSECFFTHAQAASPILENYFWFRVFFLFFSIDWIIAGLAAIPYFLFTTLNYLDYPTNSGNYLQDSAFCAMLKTPKVSI